MFIDRRLATIDGAHLEENARLNIEGLHGPVAKCMDTQHREIMLQDYANTAKITTVFFRKVRPGSRSGATD